MDFQMIYSGLYWIIQECSVDIGCDIIDKLPTLFRIFVLMCIFWGEGIRQYRYVYGLNIKV